ncbi:MAG: hypothetical protein V4596_03585 [Bdellovibrionota bacterium]
MKPLILLLCLTFTMTSFAQEGVSTDIDPARLNEVMDWVNNAKFELDTGIEDISKSSITEQESSYSQLIARVLQASGTRSNEFLMRNMLYRTQVVYKSIQNTAPSPKRDAYARRILDEGVAWSLRLYQLDKSLLEQMKSQSIPDYVRGVSFVSLGLQWTEYMFSLYYAVPDNKAKLQLMKDLMGLLYNDINNDDSVKRILAPISGKIAFKNEELKNKLQNNPPKTPIEELALARDLRRFMEQHIEAAKKLLSPYSKSGTRF